MNIKKIMIFVLCAILLMIPTGCGGNTNNAITHTVESEIYSQTDIENAVNVIKKDFSENWDGCKLLEIYYAGDDYVGKYQDYSDRFDSDEVMVLLSSFHVGFNGGNGSLNTNCTYDDWNWILVRASGGEWIHVDHGY